MSRYKSYLCKRNQKNGNEGMKESNANMEEIKKNFRMMTVRE